MKSKMYHIHLNNKIEVFHNLVFKRWGNILQHETNTFTRPTASNTSSTKTLNPS